MRHVRFRKLALAGFGPYRDRVEAEFSDGVNTLVAGNECGKSSLVAGLVATIFGLPAKGDPRGFTQARFRNWDSPQRFEGELLLEAEGEVYRLRRAFGTHEVSVSRVADGKHVPLVSGEDNPLARKRNAPYGKWLEAVLGMRSREVFEATFWVAQPLPEARELARSVQELLSGTGAGFAQALESLVAELATLTKATRDRGVTESNQRNDRELEKLASRLNELRLKTESARDTVDGLEAARERCNDVDARLSEARADLASKEATWTAWSEWRRLYAEYRQALREQSRIGEALKQALELSSEVRAGAVALQELYPEFQGAQDSAEASLDELVSLDQKLSEVRSAAQEIQGQLDRDRARCEELGGEMGALRRWGELGTSPEAETRNARRRAAELARGWSAFQASLAEAAGCDRVLAGELRVITDADPSELGALESYSATLTRLERDKVEAEFRWKAMDDQLRAFEGRRKEFGRRYSDLAALKPSAAEMLGRKLELARTERVLRQRLDEARRRLEAPPWLQAAIGLALALLAWVAAWFALRCGGRLTMGPSFWIPIGVAAMSGALGYLVSGRAYRRVRGERPRADAERLDRELDECSAEMAKIDAALGEFASGDEASLGALRMRISRRDEDARALDEQEAALPDEAERLKAQKTLERARRDYDAFVESTRGFSSRLGDIDQEYSRWKALTERRQRALGLAAEFARDHFSCEPGAAASADPRSPGTTEAWREAAKFAGIAEPDREVRTVGDLVGFLESRDAAWWDSVVREASRYEEILRNLRDLEAGLGTRQEQLARCEGRLLTLGRAYARASSELDAVLKAADGDPSKAKGRWLERRERAKELDTRRAALGALLGQHAVGSTRELHEKRIAADNHAVQALSAWKKLIDSNPGLPETDEAADPDRVEGKWRRLDDDVGRLREKVKSLEDEAHEATRGLARLEGQSPVNIAQAELEICRLEAEREAMETLADALTESCKELGAAIADFHSSHRARLEHAATLHFRRITGMEARGVVLDEEFRVSVDDGGRACDVAQLSKGARDQLYIALRLAIADLLASDVTLPMIFDDPFVSCDGARLPNLAETIRRIGNDRQVLVLSHLDALASWGPPVRIRRK